MTLVAAESRDGGQVWRLRRNQRSFERAPATIDRSSSTCPSGDDRTLLLAWPALDVAQIETGTPRARPRGAPRSSAARGAGDAEGLCAPSARRSPRVRSARSA